MTFQTLGVHIQDFVQTQQNLATFRNSVKNEFIRLEVDFIEYTLDSLKTI